MEIVEKVLGFFKAVGPIATAGFAIIFAYGIYKWTIRLWAGTKELSKSPIGIIWALIVIATFLYLYFKFLAPLLNFM